MQRRLSKTTKEVQGVLELSYRWFRLTWAIQMMIQSYLESILLYHWIIPFCLPGYLPAVNRPQLMNNLYRLIRKYIVLKCFTGTVCHTQTFGHAEKYNQTVVSGLGHYVTQYQIIQTFLFKKWISQKKRAYTEALTILRASPYCLII